MSNVDRTNKKAGVRSTEQGGTGNRRQRREEERTSYEVCIVMVFYYGRIVRKCTYAF